MTDRGHPFNETPASIEADRKFFEEARARSPRFPDINATLERRRNAREACAARTLLFMFVVGLFWGLVTNSPAAWTTLTFGGVGFGVTCWCAGARRHKNMGNNGYPGA